MRKEDGVVFTSSASYPPDGFPGNFFFQSLVYYAPLLN